MGWGWQIHDWGTINVANHFVHFVDGMGAWMGVIGSNGGDREQWYADRGRG